MSTNPITNEHRIGRVSSGRPGPLVILLGGMHGNEPSGWEAVKRVMAELEEHSTEVRGTVVGLAGNLQALAVGERFLRHDLNRCWNDASTASFPEPGSAEDTAERREQRELFAEIESALEGSFESVVFLDMHATSADGPPFAIIGDTLRNRELAFALGAPVILGLEENLEGTLLGHFAESGYAAIGFEGGREGHADTIDNQVAAAWLALAAAGSMTAAELPGYERHAGRLRKSSEGYPRVIEVHHRHGIAPGEDFRMEPGFTHFHRLHGGELLARSSVASEDRSIHAPGRGYLLMPSYQDQSGDGFFLGRRVRPIWLQLSAWLRRFNFERFLALLPGVSSTETGGRVLSVDTRVARWLSNEVFHLFGYRRRRLEGARLVFERRVERPR